MFNHFYQAVIISITALLANKARSFLTMLGIIIGVGAVIIIMAVGAGAQSLIVAQVEGLGTNLIGVLPGKAEENSPPTSAMGIIITTLTYNDAIALKDKKNVPNFTDIVAYVNGIGTVSWQANSYDTNLSGCTTGYPKVEGGEVESGRFFNNEEEKNLSRVAVLGSMVKKELFGDSEAVGKKIKIKKHTFEVIGVMKERGTVAFQDYDDQIFLPIRTMQKLIVGVDHVNLIRAKVDYEENIERAMEDAAVTLRERHNILDPTGSGDDFTVRSAAQMLDMIRVITDALRYFLAAIGGLSLIVGGIGIMNIMLVSVSERTHEIGLRKAIGANNLNIMWQFLIEAVVITSLGGLIGIIGGILASWLIAAGAQAMDYSWEFVVSPLAMFLAVAVSIIVGLVFGLYPARKASKLEPIEALRHE